MNITEFSTIILTPSEGYRLTQKDATVELRDRIVADRIALGKHDSADNYKEITVEEAEAIIAEQRELTEDEGKKEED